MAEIDPESVQGEYSDSDEDAVSSGTGPIRWIRDPSTMDRRRRGSDSRIRDPSIREYPSEIWVRPPTETGRSSSTESDRRGAQYLRPASRLVPSRTPSTPRREQPRPAPPEVCQVPVDHQAGGEVDVPVTGDVPTGSVSAHQGATLSRGRSTVRNESQHENQSYCSSYCLPPVLAGPQSTPLTSTVGESPTTARGPSASPRKAARDYHSDTSKSTDGAAPNRQASKSPPKLADDDAFPGANAMSEIWPLYLEHARGKDKEMVSAWNTDLDAILIFAALFSAVLTTFIIESYSNLQADPTSEVLQAILFELRMARNASAARESPIRQFEVAASAVRVNVYWFSSLILSLATALITILAKQWVNYLLAGLSSIPADRARLRQYRIEGMHRWHLPAVLSFLPILLHVALLLFFAGLVDFVWDVNESVALIAAILVCTTSVVYIVANLLAYVYPDCPFKTSVTDFVVVVIDLLIVAYGRGRLAAMRLGRASARLWDRGVRACTSWYRCYQREDASVEDGGAVPMTRIDTITSSETRNYEPLRITSLRRQGEQFIEENKTTMDAHILLWIMRHADRLREVQKLSNAIIHFPHLVLHRRLFIEKGAYGYLERLLQSSVSRSYSRLPKKRRVAVTSVMYALAVLEAEVAMDSVQDEPIDGGDTTNNTPHATAPSPYTMIESSINPASSPLSPHTFPVIVSLLNEAHNLPFSVLASALRLSVRIPDSTVRGRVPSIKPIVHEFLVRVAQFQPPSGEHSDITHAVNTVIYLALHDASYPRRHGFVIPPIGDTRYWLDYLSRLVLQPFITPSARRQLCWAICALTPSLSVPPLGVIVKPRIPRIGRIHTMAGRLTALVSCDTDQSILRAALVALEGILWAGTAREEQSGVTFVAHLLRRVHLTFTTRLRRRLVMGQLQLSSDITAMTPSITRIAIYLSIFHPKTTEHARVALLRNVFGILAYLLEASQEDPASLRMDMYACRSTWSPLTAASLRGIEARRWIYRAAGRIVTLLLNLGGTTRTRHTLRIDPRELVFTDNDDAPVVAALTLAFQSISGRMTMAASPGWTIDPLVLDSFAAIMKDIFVLGMRRAGSHPEPVDPEEVGIRQWDWEAPQVLVAHLAGRPGALSALLVVSSYDSTVRLEVLRTAIRAMCAVLHADTGSGDAHSPPAIPRHDSNHPATLLADMLRGQYQWVCQKLAEQIEGTHLTEPSMEGALIDFIRLSANLAFYRAPSDTSPDPVVLGNMLLFLSALLSRSTTSAAVRRHAWGTLGSIVAMCTQRMPEIRNDPDPERHFRFDTFDPEGIAVGLMRALALSSLETGIDIEPHCERCALPLHKCHGLPTPGSSDEDSPGGTSTRMPVVYKLIFSTTLTAVVALWKADDDESVDVRGRLRQHGLASRLKPLLDLEESEAKWLTKEAMTKMFDAERDTPPDSLETPS